MPPGRPASKNAHLAPLGTEGFGTLYSHNGVLPPHTSSRQYPGVGPSKRLRTVGLLGLHPQLRTAGYSKADVIDYRSQQKRF